MKRLATETDFLLDYYKRGDCFPDLLARSVYLSKYCRGKENWTDTILRVVDGNCDYDSAVTLEERKELFHTFWTMQALPPGRGLWVGGVPNIPVDARYNCWFTSIKELSDWPWIANQLMLGGGVGVSLFTIDNLPIVSSSPCTLKIACKASHPDFLEVKPDACNFVLTHLEVEDSREGWADALQIVLEYAFSGKSLNLDVSPVRARGQLIRTFGGIASGPGPLVEMLRAVWNIVRLASSRKLNSVECLDITNLVGRCIKSGNVRRSALLVLGNPSDMEFRNAKKDFEAVRSHRHTSNNSIAFTEFSQFDNFNWRGLVEDNIEFGEPGVANLALARRTDPGVCGFNPCVEVPLHEKEACNLAEAFLGVIKEWGGSVKRILRLLARYSLRQRLVPSVHPVAEAVRKTNMRVGVGLGGICDYDWSDDLLREWSMIVRSECNNYADNLKVSRPIATTTVKPSGTISKLSNSCPGMHKAHADYYLQRIRIAENEPMALALKEAGVPSEHCYYDQSGKTLVFSFPMKARNPKVTTQNETLRSQFERQLSLQQNWADNSVSATISFDKNEPEQLALGMAEFIPRLKSASFLAKTHGYKQPPYEAISQSDYEELRARINLDATLIRGSDIEITECENGACPIR